MLELMTIFTSFGALGAPLSPGWLDVFWEYSRPQVCMHAQVVQACEGQARSHACLEGARVAAHA